MKESLTKKPEEEGPREEERKAERRAMRAERTGSEVKVASEGLRVALESAWPSCRDSSSRWDSRRQGPSRDTSSGVSAENSLKSLFCSPATRSCGTSVYDSLAGSMLRTA